MVAPPPAFTIRHPDYAMPDNVTPFRAYDDMGPLWDPVPFFSPKQRTEEWTTNQFITFEQLEEYGAYYVGDRSDMYALSHFVYYDEGQYMPVFRKISGYDMFNDYRQMSIMRNRNRRAIPMPVSLNPPPPSAAAAPPPNAQGQQLKRLDFFITTEGVQINPRPNPIHNGANDYMEEDAMNVDNNDEGEEEGNNNGFWDEIIEDYFSDRASSSESPGIDDKW